MIQRRKKWRIGLAFEPNRYAREQLQKAYEQINPVETRSTGQPFAIQPAVARQVTIKRGRR